MPMLTPVKFDFTQSIGAGAQFLPLTNWQYETPDVACMVELIERASATGLRSFLTTGGDTIKQEGPVQAGGTAGVTPSRLNTEPVTGKANQFQKLLLQYTNPTGGAITIDGTVILTPLGGGGGRGGRRAPSRRRGRR